MNYEITPSAHTSISEILWGDTFKDPLNAKALFERLEGKFKEIGNAPDIGTQRLDLGEEIRSTTVESYVVYFTIKEDGIAAILLIGPEADDPRHWFRYYENPGTGFGIA